VQRPSARRRSILAPIHKKHLFNGSLFRCVKAMSPSMSVCHHEHSRIQKRLVQWPRSWLLVERSAGQRNEDPTRDSLAMLSAYLGLIQAGNI
jgi:hypothetical protein